MRYPGWPDHIGDTVPRRDAFWDAYRTDVERWEKALASDPNMKFKDYVKEQVDRRRSAFPVPATRPEEV